MQPRANSESQQGTQQGKWLCPIQQYVHQWKHVNGEARPYQERERVHTYEMAVDVGQAMPLPNVTLHEPEIEIEDD